MRSCEGTEWPTRRLAWVGARKALVEAAEVAVTYSIKRPLFLLRGLWSSIQSWSREFPPSPPTTTTLDGFAALQFSASHSLATAFALHLPIISYPPAAYLPLSRPQS
jgi:hypothetical protein